MPDGANITEAAADGASLLDALAAFVHRFVACTETQAAAIALWTAHTWTFDAADTTPRLAVQSAEKQSGKTRLLEALDLVAPGPLPVANISVAALFRVIAAGPVTLLWDEVDSTFNNKGTGTAEELRGLLNAGYRRGAQVARVVGEGKKMRVERFPVFAPIALAGIGSLPDTVEDRSIIIRLRRRAPNEHVERFRRRVVEPDAARLRDELAGWSAGVIEELKDLHPDLPRLSDRAADVWEPLLAIADLAGGNWPDRARDAAITLSGAQPADDDTLGVRLLADVRTVMGARDRVWTAELLEGLAALEESPWGDWYGKPLDARRLAKFLKPYGVRSREVRIGDRNAKGYVAEDLADPWSRYVPTLAGVSATSATSATPLASPVADVAGVALHAQELYRPPTVMDRYELLRDTFDAEEIDGTEHELTPPHGDGDAP